MVSEEIVAEENELGDVGEISKEDTVLSDTVSSSASGDIAAGGTATPEATTGSAGSQNPNGSVGAVSPGTPTSKVWVEDTDQVWVVDQEAWTEQVPVYATSERSVCNICSADITGNTYEHGKAHMLAGEGSGHHSEVTQYISHYETVEHPEVAHWETVVVGGHWE